jgi:hypothetical protein
LNSSSISLLFVLAAFNGSLLALRVGRDGTDVSVVTAKSEVKKLILLSIVASLIREDC